MVYVVAFICSCFGLVFYKGFEGNKPVLGCTALVEHLPSMYKALKSETSKHISYSFNRIINVKNTQTSFKNIENTLANLFCCFTLTSVLVVEMEPRHYVTHNPAVLYVCQAFGHSFVLSVDCSGLFPE